MKRIKNNYGFTLMEIIVAAGIFSILGTITILFYTQCTRSWQRLTNESDLRSTGLNDILYMTRELGKAAIILIPTAPNNNSITFDLPCDNASASACCQVPPAIRTNPPAMPINNPSYPHYPLVGANRNTQWDTCNRFQYRISNHQLQRWLVVQDILSHTISPDVTSVTFEDSFINPDLNNDEIKITLTLTRPMLAGNTLTVTLIGIVNLRNQQ